MRNKIKELNTENIIWIIYIFISLFAIISNYYEKKYEYFKVIQDKRKYRQINLTIFTVTVIIYLYFLFNNFTKSPQNKYDLLSTFASILFTIAGIIILYVEYQTVQDENIGII